MSQHLFVSHHGGRTNMAILFFALAMMTLFNDKIDPLKKRILFIVFMASCMVSHYSTTYMFFFIMAGTFVGIEALSKKYTVKKVISLTIMILFFALIFFWYSQVTEATFNAGVSFIENTLSNLNKFFLEETRSSNVQAMLGKGVMEKGIPHMIEFVFTWLTFAFIGIGIITLIRRYREMSFPELNFKKPEFLKDKFEVTYFVIALACAGLLVAVVLTPYISIGYSLERAYLFGIVILSVFFVIGGITLSKHFFFKTFKKSFIKNASQKISAKRKPWFFGKAFFSKERFDGKNDSEVRAYLIVLLILIPYFLSVTGVTYQMFGYSQAITLNSEGEQYDLYYVHDQESYGAKWLDYHADKRQRVYADPNGKRRLISQGKITPSLINRYWLSNLERIGNIYLTHQNVVLGELIDPSGVYNMTDYRDIFTKKNEVYDSGSSKVYR